MTNLCFKFKTLLKKTDHLGTESDQHTLDEWTIRIDIDPECPTLVQSFEAPPKNQTTWESESAGSAEIKPPLMNGHSGSILSVQPLFKKMESESAGSAEINSAHWNW